MTTPSAAPSPRGPAAQPPPVLEARQVELAFADGTRALAGVSLTVGSGEVVVLIGESGAGKTSLLRAFHRMVEPSAGSIRVEGEEVRRLDPVALRRRIGYVPQNGGLIPHWSVRRNVELVPRLLGWEPARRRRRAQEMLSLVGLEPSLFGERPPGRLSGGERQRVAFARALAAEPHAVLLDEPFGALDALTRAELRREFQQIQRRAGAAALLVTHDLDEALQLGDRVAVMRRGRILQTDAPEKLTRAPRDDYVRRLLDLAGRGKGG